MIKNIIVVCLGIVALLYLLNLGIGILEFIPDNLPFIGNLDEGGAVVLLLMCLRYFGFDLRKVFKNDDSDQHDGV